jgi:class 3 adenylate cyclase
VVKVASRVEAPTKQSGDVILLTESTHTLLAGTDSLIDRGRIEIKGKSESLQIFAVLPTAIPT